MDFPTIGQHVTKSADAALISDRTGRIVFANAASEKLFGYQTDELINANVDQLIPETMREAHQERLEKYAADSHPRPFSKQPQGLFGRRKDGSVFPAEISLTPLGSGQEMTVMAMIRDISDRMAIDLENEKVRQSLDAVDEAVFMFSAETLEFSYVNTGACRQTGYSPTELLGGMTPVDIKPEFNEATFREMISPLLTLDRSVVTFETVHQRKDRSILPVEVMLQHLGPSPTQRTGLMALIRDITARKAQHSRLLSSEQAFRSAFEDAPVGMAIADLSHPEQRAIVSANTALGEMLGYPREELEGMTFEALTHPEDRVATSQGAADLAEGRSSIYRTEKRYLHADGHIVWAVLSTVRLAGIDSPQALAHIVDISRRVAVEAERDKREQYLSFLADIRLAVLADRPIHEVLTLVLELAKTALEAVHVVVAMPDASGFLRITAADTVIAVGAIGSVLPEGSQEERAFATTETIELQDIASSPSLDSASPHLYQGLGPAVFAPMLAGSRVLGVLAIGRPNDAATFSPADLVFIQALTSESAVALELQRSRDQQTRLQMAEDRERIARELQDRVIQRLFAVGMQLQGSLLSPDRLLHAAEVAIEELDESISVVRDSIFKLGSGLKE